MMKRRYFIRFGLLSLVFPYFIEAFEVKRLSNNPSLEEALYINCLQRTQTQQLLKTYLMIALNSNYNNPKKRLPEAVKEYDKRFYLLYDYFMKRLKDKKAISKMQEAKRLWEESKSIILQKPTMHNALILDKNFKKMIHLLSAPKMLNKKKGFKAIGKTGGMCRIPLYMANLYLMKLWGVKLPDYEDGMKSYIKKFRDTMKFLESYPKDTPEIKKELKEASRSFIFFEMMYRSKSIAIPTLISKKADDIFMNIQKVKRDYAKLIK